MREIKIQCDCGQRYKFEIFKDSVGLMTIIFLLLGVSSAYKIATG